MRLRRVPGVLGALLLLTAGCSSGSAGYSHRPYPDGQLDAGLASAQADFVQSLIKGRTDLILQEHTADGRRDRMRRFLASYAGHPARSAGDEVGDYPFVSGQYINVMCAPGHVQRVGLAWAWINDGWRAWPMYRLFPLDHCG